MVAMFVIIDLDIIYRTLYVDMCIYSPCQIAFPQQQWLIIHCQQAVNQRTFSPTWQVNSHSTEKHIYVYIHLGCPTTYQTRQFFNNFTTNENIAQLGILQTHSSSFLTYERKT
jgi:hypothetical protein